MIMIMIHDDVDDDDENDNDDNDDDDDDDNNDDDDDDGADCATNNACVCLACSTTPWQHAVRALPWWRPST